MDFFPWSSKDPLIINEYGIPEPISNNVKYPDVLFVPLVAYDNHNNRIGYGGGFYDRYINKIRKNKNNYYNWVSLFISKSKKNTN